MPRNVGLWIDHKQAYINWQGEDNLQIIPSNVEPKVPFSGGSRIGGLYNQNLGKELRFNDRFEHQLHEYYEKVVSMIHGAEYIFIMGPGEAKKELERELKKHKGLGKHVLKVETADKMTEHQIVARVKHFYQQELAA